MCNNVLAQQHFAIFYTIGDDFWANFFTSFSWGLRTSYHYCISNKRRQPQKYFTDCSKNYHLCKNNISDEWKKARPMVSETILKMIVCSTIYLCTFFPNPNHK